jgi:pyridoxal phosphate enzyme (YggS family)
MCGRDPHQVNLVVVTKTYPASDVAILADLGVRDVAENKDQDGRAKSAEVRLLRTQADLRWHMIGQLQRNKCSSVARWADDVESVDRIALVEPLARTARDRTKVLDVLIQVNLDEVSTPGRGGAAPDDVDVLAAAIDRESSLRLRGVMGVAPLAGDARAAFERLGVIAAALRASYPGATVFSAGMSGDLEEAIAAGSTQVRIGSAVLGRRTAGR